MSNATSLSDTLSNSVPKLDSSGLNWAIFSFRFQDAVEAKGFWGHFDGTTKRPIQADSSKSPTEAELTAMSEWDRNERSAKTLLTQKLPDSALMRIRNKVTVGQRFMDSKCPYHGNVREFLNTRSTIIGSLPHFLSNYASSLLANARLYATSKTIVPDSLISLISEEYDRQSAQRARRHGGGAGKGKTEDKDEALVVSVGTKQSDAANAAIDSDSEDEGAFFIDYENESETDWFTEASENEAGSGQDTEELSGIDECEYSSTINVDSDNTLRTEIYDSGCSKHLTPYRDALENFIEISPKSFRANGANFAQLRLTEVLYSPDVGFSGNKCTIRGRA